MRLFVSVLILLIQVSAPSYAQTNTKQLPPETEKQYKQAVEIARQGDAEKGMKMLNKILQSHPDNYPVIRDYIIIATWNNDCDEALSRYQKIKSYPQQEPYLIAPVGECIANQGDLYKAQAFLEKGQKKYSDDEEINRILTEVNDNIRDSMRGNLNVNLVNDNTNGTANEWRLRLRYTQPLDRYLAVYGRYLYATTKDPDFDTENMNRIGVGAVFYVHRQVTLDIDFSVDINDSEESGGAINLNYEPTTLWDMNFQYATYAEDISLRAKFQGIEADRASYNVFYHTSDYQWEWLASISAYDYTDSNRRNSFYTEGGFAFELAEKREQRIIAEFSFETNTLADTVYFNPDEAITLGLTYKLDLVFDSQYDRHVDTLYINAALYDQKGFIEDYGTNLIGGAFYQQSYDFNDTTSLTYGLGYYSKVYDGDREGNLLGKVDLNKQF